MGVSGEFFGVEAVYLDPSNPGQLMAARRLLVFEDGVLVASRGPEFVEVRADWPLVAQLPEPVAD